jgi:hypothetical protein
MTQHMTKIDIKKTGVRTQTHALKDIMTNFKFTNLRVDYVIIMPFSTKVTYFYQTTGYQQIKRLKT